MTRILLIGFMGAGKTTLGRALAHDMHLQFIDMDGYIVSRFRKSVSELFAERGEEGFRLLERSVLHEVAEFEDVVIATGGGVPCFFDNMDYMNAQGTTVYLRAATQVLHRRLTISHTQRPLVASKTGDELTDYIVRTVAQREAFYTRAQHTFCSDQLEDVHQIDSSILRFKREVLGMGLE